MVSRVAILVDGDNICGKHAAAITALSARHGTVGLARVYLDAQKNSDWHSAVGYRLVHAGTGKNASDLLMAIDAMELACADTFDTFVIASSDGDFTHLALRLRERGLKAHGVGEEKSTHALRESFKDFVQLEPTGGRKSSLQRGPKDCIDEDVRRIISDNCKNSAGMTFADINSAMQKKHNVRIKQRAESTWKAYFNARSTLFDIDTSGPVTVVKTKLPPLARAS